MHKALQSCIAASKTIRGEIFRIYIYLDVMPSVFMYAICLITLLVSLVMDIVAIRFIVLVLRPILRQSLLPLLGTASAMFRK